MDDSDLYVAIGWPEIQDYMDEKGFEDNCFLINDDKGLEIFGSSAYMCNLAWLKSIQDGSNV